MNNICNVEVEIKPRHAQHNSHVRDRIMYDKKGEKQKYKHVCKK